MRSLPPLLFLRRLKGGVKRRRMEADMSRAQSLFLITQTASSRHFPGRSATDAARELKKKKKKVTCINKAKTHTRFERTTNVQSAPRGFLISVCMFTHANV